MAYHDELKAALIKHLGDRVVFLPGWDKKYRSIGWTGKNARPVALMVHHTAGAATESTSAKHPGNQKGANAGQVKYVKSHFTSPCSNFTLDRDGTVYVNTAYPCWHSGTGTFKGVRGYSKLNVPDDRFHDVGMGVECVSRGQKKDFTSAMKWSFGDLANAVKESAEWKGLRWRLPNHRTWDDDSGKVDSRYSLLRLRSWAVKAAARKALRNSK